MQLLLELPHQTIESGQDSRGGRPTIERIGEIQPLSTSPIDTRATLRPNFRGWKSFYFFFFVLLFLFPFDFQLDRGANRVEQILCLWLEYIVFSLLLATSEVTREIFILDCFNNPSQLVFKVRWFYGNEIVS